MASTTLELRCPGCGVSRTPKHFGINEDGEFDAELRPEHTIEQLTREFHGGGHIDVDRGPLTLEQAQAMYASLQAALGQLGAEIAEATTDGDSYEEAVG